MLALLLLSVCLSSLLVDLARSVSFLCDLFPLEPLLILVILSSLSLAPDGLSVLTLLLLPVSALPSMWSALLNFVHCLRLSAEVD